MKAVGLLRGSLATASCLVALGSVLAPCRTCLYPSEVPVCARQPRGDSGLLRHPPRNRRHPAMSPARDSGLGLSQAPGRRSASVGCFVPALARLRARPPVGPTRGFGQGRTMVGCPYRMIRKGMVEHQPRARPREAFENSRQQLCTW